MNVIFLPPSDQELHEAVKFYEDQMTGLGTRFYLEFERILAVIASLPYAWRKIGPNTRRINLRRFPYLVLYVVEEDHILITCIAHQHRDPRYFVDRIS